ncbi:HAMP domain-containing sensor histidine kinase [Pusillimonas sp. NJUB218]|uniref:sensor histidine kinase n=1 Tax=Pusillimonas sp. NJUB218 TaxID=2023230 RepID=UPI000F4BEB8C|nr:HAMP domain-containing sensor histidine kinase [Pusillimonas sp. NJUB218]ROT45767.1 hypothetical protein CHR62_05800 [Pusillimonas sp. NJUB218]
MRSISYRIYRVIAVVGLISLVAMFVSTTLVNEDLEDTMLRVELAQEREFFLAQGFDASRPLLFQGPGITRVYRPAEQGHIGSDADVLPAIFEGLSLGFMGEISRDDRTYLVSVSTVSGGTLYLARDITHFEEREWLFRMAILVVGVLVGLLVVVLSVLGARRVVQPLSELAERIQRLPVGPSIDRLPGHWQDAELQTIAGAFNDFVTELEAYVRREKSLLALASHELRTPIAIITGALDILEQRGGLSAADQATLGRIRRAADEMQSNVRVLLALARKSDDEDNVAGPVSLATEIHGVLEGLATDFPIASRVTFNASGPGQVCADPVVVRMLLRNLIQNALQHTARRIYIALHNDVVEVRDEGPGLNPVAQDILQGKQDLASGSGPVSGLGLYLVTLMVERLGWRLDLAQTTSSGTTVRVGPRDSAFFSDHAVNEQHNNGADN